MASGALAAAEARSFTVWGDIPEGCRNVPLVAGIDEAGRGSVIGKRCPLRAVCERGPLLCQEWRHLQAAQAHARTSTGGRRCLCLCLAGDMIYGIAFWPADADAEISRLGFQGSTAADSGHAIELLCRLAMRSRWAPCESEWRAAPPKWASVAADVCVAWQHSRAAMFPARRSPPPAPPLDTCPQTPRR